MEDTTVNNEQDTATTKNKSSRFVKYLRRAALTVVLLLVIFSLALIIIAQTDSFRQAALQSILKMANSFLIGKVELKDIRFSSAEGIELSQFRLLSAGDTVASIERLTLSLDYKPLFDNKAYINRITLENPRIKLLRSLQDSLWNIDKIAKPSDDTTASEPADWLIKLKRLAMRNGSFIMIDSTALYDNQGRISFVDLYLDSLELDLSGAIDLKKNDFQAVISKMSFIERNSEFRLNKFSSQITLNKDYIEAKSTTAETAHSKLKFDARMSSMNIFGAPEEMDIAKAIFNVKLRGAPVNPLDINEFADIYIKLGSVYSVDAEISGSLNELNIESISVVGENTSANLKGRLYSLLEPEKFRYEVEIDNTVVFLKDLNEILPEFDFTALPDFQFVKLNKTMAEGGAEDASLDFNAKVAEGTVKGIAGIYFGNGRLKYQCNVETSGFNPAQIFKSKDFAGFINGSIMAEGDGYEPEKMSLKLDLQSHNSHFYNAHWNSGSVKATISNGLIVLDTFAFELKKPFEDDPYHFYETEPFINLSGSLALSSNNLPVYNISGAFSGINPALILNNDDFPNLLSGSMSLSGSGFHPDSLDFLLISNFSECAFPDKHIMPFGLNAEFKRRQNGDRHLNIASDFLNARLYGKYTLEPLIESIVNQGLSLANFSQSKVNKIIPKKDLSDTAHYFKIEPIAEFPDIDCRFFAEIKDVSAINSFLEGLNIYSQGYVSFRFKSGGSKSFFDIDSIRLEAFQLTAGDFRMNLRRFFFRGVMSMELLDSIPKFSHLSLMARSRTKSDIADIELTRARINLDFDGDKTDYSMSAIVNNMLDMRSTGSVGLTDFGLDIKADTLETAYLGNYRWKATKPVKAQFAGDAVKFEQFEMKRDTGETITLGGVMRFDAQNNLKVNISDLQVNDFFPLAGRASSDPLWKVFCNVDDIAITISGAWEKPVISANLSATNLIYDKNPIGSLRSDFFYKDSIITGSISVYNPAEPGLPDLMAIDINTMPFNLALADIKERFHNANPVDIKVKANKVPLQIAGPFVEQLENLRGNGNADLSIKGFFPDNIGYSGKASFDNASFILKNTNISYTAQGNVSFVNDTIYLNNITLNNLAEDIPGGSAIISGYVDLDDFNIGYIDISVKSQRLLVLSPASVRALPFLYGDFVIATGDHPLRFYGTMSEPNLEGDVNVLSARLIMPALIAQTATRSTFRYEYLEDRTRLHIITTPDSSAQIDSSEIISNPLNGKIAVTQAEANFADLIDYNIRIKILGRFTINMDLGAAAQLYAEIGAYDPTQPLWYRKFRNNPEAKLYGQLVVREGSNLTYIIANLTTSGNILFTTGSIDNPELDLKAEYRGKTMEGNSSKNYMVQIFITGPKSKPNIRFTYFMDGQEATGDPKRIEEDALMLLLTGRTKTGSSMGGFGNIDLKDNIYTAGQSLVSKSLTSMLLGTGIQSVDVDLAGGAMDETKLKFTGQLFGNVSWTIGGTLADLKSNNEVTIDWPIPVNSKLLNNLILQITQSTNVNTIQTQDQKSWEVKLKFGKSW